MESPLKKLNFGAADKENASANVDFEDLANEIDSHKPPMEKHQEESKTVVASGLKPEELDEPLLQENPQRFVLFPIKYHEVSNVSFTRKVLFDAS
jgi:ribonucleoside-diphosphate reductase subunit M2